MRWRAILHVLTLLSVFLTPGSLFAQNSGAPRALVELVNDVKLGVQVLGGVEQHDQDVLPITNQSFEYLQRPVRGGLSHAIPYYGIGLALQVRGAEVSVAYRQGDGIQSSNHWFRFEDGTRAFPYTIRFYNEWNVQAEYFILDWIGVGAAYHLSSHMVHDSKSSLFSGSLSRINYSLYVPLRQEWGPIRIFGRVGAALGDGNDSYYLDFRAFQSPETPDEPSFEPEEAPRTFFEETSATMNAQFGRVGVEVPIWGAAVRPSVGVERLHVPSRTTAWSYDVRVEMGLPF